MTRGLGVLKSGLSTSWSDVGRDRAILARASAPRTRYVLPIMIYDILRDGWTASTISCNAKCHICHFGTIYRLTLSHSGIYHLFLLTNTLLVSYTKSPRRNVGTSNKRSSSSDNIEIPVIPQPPSWTKVSPHPSTFPGPKPHVHSDQADNQDNLLLGTTS
jgi:hypothetical protein